MISDPVPLEISVEETQQLLVTDSDGTQLVDVREPDEVSVCRLTPALYIPMRQIPENLDALPRDRHLLIYCHHGGRSMRVTQFLRARGFSKASNMAGGIDAWAERLDPTMKRY